MSPTLFSFSELIRENALEIGDGYRAKNEELGGQGPVFLRAAYLQGRGFVLDGPERFVSSDVASFGAKVAQLRDVVITTKGNSTGRVGQIRLPEVGAIYSPHLSYWRSKDKERIDQDFLYYWSQSPEFRMQLAGMAASTDMAPYLSLSDQRRLRISLPDIPAQRAAGSLLRALDDKIELNQRMNETLGAMARAIFKDWFIDFGPSHAKQEGGNPYLAPPLWSLFPDLFGPMGCPAGWDQKPLDDVADFLNGLALQKFPATKDGELSVIKIAELRSGITEKSGKAAADIPAQYIVDDGDVLFSWSGSLTHLVWAGGRGALNQHLFKVSSQTYPKWFFYLWIEQHMPNFQAIAASKATTMGHIQRHHLHEALTVIPSADLLAVADEVVGPIFDRTLANNLESRTLAHTRDLLLPRLMSGEIRIREAEMAVGDEV